MKKLSMVLSMLFLAGTLTVLPSYSFSQVEHEGHEHESEAVQDEHAHEEQTNEGEEEHTDEVVLSEQAISLFNIQTQQAERRELTGTATVPARVSYNTEAMAHIGTQVQGRAQKIAVRLGDHVKAGDLLLVVDSPELGAAQSDYLQADAAVSAAEAGVEAAKTMVEVAQTAFERAEDLREANGISISQFLEEQGALREAEANHRSAQADLRVAQSARLAAENQLHIYGYKHEDCDALLATGEIDTRYEIHAPINGQVIEREVTPGEVVDPGQEALMILANMEDLWVLGDVPERTTPRVTVGTSARITMNALGDLAFEGKVSYVAPHLDPRTRTATVRMVVPADRNPHDEEHSHDDHEAQVDASHLLKPGMFGQAELSLTALPGQASNAVLVVPEEAIQTVEGGPAVFVPVKGEPNTFAKRAIRTGPRVGKWVPVLSGLEEGEAYVANNTFVLKAELGKGGAGHAH